MSRFRLLSRFLQVVFVMICLIFIIQRPDITPRKKFDAWNVTSWMPGPHSERIERPSRCDPYAQPGHLFTSDVLHDSRYIIYNDRSGIRPGSPSADWVVPSITALIHENKFEQLTWLRNRSILIIGDSIDRNLVTHFGRRSLAGSKGGRHEFFIPPDEAKVAVTKQPTHQIGIARQPQLNFTIYNWFMMGVAVQDEVPFFHPREDLPQKFESRFETFYLPLLRKSLLPRPDLIIINSGFWDLDYLARSRAAHYKLPDVPIRAEDGPTNLQISNRHDGNPLSLTELAYHRTRMRALVEYTRRFIQEIDEQFGEPGRSVGIAYRSMQTGNASYENAFNPERVRQLDNSNRVVMKELKVPVIEWGKMTVGLEYQLDDPPIVGFVFSLNQSRPMC